jgi:TonB family protein
MKYCPQCNTQYDYDMSFCLQDGTPLKTLGVAPQSENNSEKTIELPQTSVSQPNNEKTLELPQNLITQSNKTDSEKTLVLPKTVVSEPTIAAENWNNNQTNQAQFNRSLPNQEVLKTSQFESEPRKSKLGLLVGIIAAGLLLISSAIGAIFYFQSQSTKDFALANTNLNNNKNNQVQTNNSNINTIVNNPQNIDNNAIQDNRLITNSTVKPTPKITATVETTPKPTPTVKLTETSEPTPIKTPTPTPTPAPTKTPTPEPDIPKVVSGGVVNGKATNLVRPSYPPAARAVGASGAVNVRVIIDENGNVIAANAVSGHPMLRQSAEQAARASKFSPTVLMGQRVKVTGVIVYNFTP